MNEKSCTDIINDLYLNNPNNVSLSYININSIRNKLDDLSTIVSNNIDVLCIAETKLDNSFPEPQFFLKGYKKPYRLAVSDSSGGLLTYVNSDIPSTRLTSYTFPKDIQCLVIELNLLKQKWLVFSIYRNPAQDPEARGTRRDHRRDTQGPRLYVG